MRVTKRVNIVGYFRCSGNAHIALLFTVTGIGIFLYFWYTICVAGVTRDIFSKDNFLRVGVVNKQHLPITVITIQEKKSYFSEHSMTI